MSDMYGGRPMVGGEHYYKAVETPAGRKSSGGGIPKGLIIALSVVAGIIVIVGVGAAVVLNLRPVKTARAVANTLKDGGYLIEDLQKGAFVSDKYTLSVAGNINADGTNVSGNVDVIMDGKTKQLYASANVPMLGNVEATVELNSKSLKAEVPTVDSHTFVYNYKEDNTGYITEAIGQDGIDTINTALQKLYDIEGGDTGAAKDIAKITAKWLMKLDYEKLDPVKTTVDGKSRKCSGTRVTVTPENVRSYAEDVLDYIEEEYSDDIEEYNSYASEYDQFDRDEILDEICDDWDITLQIDIYTYSGKVAAVEISSDNGGATVQVLFHGGDYRLQNVEARCIYAGYSPEELFEIQGTRDGSEENYCISYDDGYDTLNVSYDRKSGDYSVSVDDYGTVTGNLDCSSKGIVCVIDIPSSLGGDIGGSGTISYLKGADLNKFEGEELDIGEASLDELSSLTALETILDLIM